MKYSLTVRYVDFNTGRVHTKFYRSANKVIIDGFEEMWRYRAETLNMQRVNPT